MAASRQFRFNWKVTLFAVGFTVAFVNLGIWQLSRAEEKQQLLAANAKQRALPAVSSAELMAQQDKGSAGQQPYQRRVELNGQYDQQAIYLLDNRVLNGTVGFEVIQPFHDAEGGMTFFVNRGFAPMGPTRQDLPQLATPQGKVRLLASVYRPDGKAFLLADAMPSGTDTYPKVIQSLSELPYPESFRFSLRLDQTSPGALPRHWPLAIMSPATHTGYALQWFTMALALALLWLYFSFPKKGEQT